jgi:hypothetical protein
VSGSARQELTGVVQRGTGRVKVATTLYKSYRIPWKRASGPWCPLLGGRGHQGKGEEADCRSLGLHFALAEKKKR